MLNAMRNLDWQSKSWLCILYRPSYTAPRLSLLSFSFPFVPRLSLSSMTILETTLRMSSNAQSARPNVINLAMEVAKTLAKETHDAIDPASGAWNDDNPNQRLFDTYMGPACDVVQVQAVLGKITTYSNGVLRSNKAGYAYNSHGSILLASGFLPASHDPSEELDCPKIPERNDAYTFLHETSHAFDFVQANEDSHPVDDGNTAPIRTSEGNSKCYEIDCVKENTGKDTIFYNGFMARAHQYLAWSIHCQDMRHLELCNQLNQIRKT